MIHIVIKLAIDLLNNESTPKVNKAKIIDKIYEGWNFNSSYILYSYDFTEPVSENDSFFLHVLHTPTQGDLIVPYSNYTANQLGIDEITDEVLIDGINNGDSIFYDIAACSYDCSCRIDCLC